MRGNSKDGALTHGTLTLRRHKHSPYSKKTAKTGETKRDTQEWASGTVSLLKNE